MISRHLHAKPEYRSPAWRRSTAFRFKMLAVHNKCWICGTTLEFHTMTLDHVTPLGLGGLDVSGNLMPACQGCNQKDGHRLSDLLQRDIMAIANAIELHRGEAWAYAQHLRWGGRIEVEIPPLSTAERVFRNPALRVNAPKKASSDSTYRQKKRKKRLGWLSTA